MHTSPFPTAPIAGTRVNHTDMDMVVDLFIGDNAEVCVFHDRPFSKTLSWLEYDCKNSRVDFVMEDGDLRNFGIPVSPRLKPYFQNTYTVCVIEMDPATKKPVQAVELPLIMHGS